ncbi:hypothetical protein [Absidia glauca]|uniref:Uncharacterized protein n=1 Tax=Absidia glauca TaxID=4829 RepID=A0A168RMT8_ABSGL|nr:hypothetical protein [Absidia glauca]
MESAPVFSESSKEEEEEELYLGSIKVRWALSLLANVAKGNDGLGVAGKGVLTAFRVLVVVVRELATKDGTTPATCTMYRRC